MKTTKIALFMAALMFAPSAFAYEITPYVGLGIVVDKANTSAKRLGFDKTKNKINLVVAIWRSTRHSRAKSPPV